MRCVPLCDGSGKASSCGLGRQTFPGATKERCESFTASSGGISEKTNAATPARCPLLPCVSAHAPSSVALALGAHSEGR